MSFKEHNNRNIANQYAEYITGQELRQYIANKVKEYVPDYRTVFDGTVGSGQLMQYMNVETLYGVDIQEKAIETCKENFPNSHLWSKSLFQFNENIECDVVVMNPPFSLKFKDLLEEDQRLIQEEFPRKKSGAVDEIFVLKTLKYTKRYGIYILFPGVGYRQTERHFRAEIGTKLQELNLIENAFEDTTIAVLVVVIDKEKTTREVKQSIYDCRKKQELMTGSFELNEGFDWETPRVEVEEEEIDIDEVERIISDARRKTIKAWEEHDKLIFEVFGRKVPEWK